MTKKLIMAGVATVLAVAIITPSWIKQQKAEEQRARAMSSKLSAQPDTNSFFQMRLVREQAGKDTVEMEVKYDDGRGGEVTEALHVVKSAALDHTAVASAYVAKDPIAGSPQVVVEFTTQGAVLFHKITRENVDRKLAILIRGKVVSAPRILEPILGGSAQIAGDFTVEEADEIARGFGRRN